MMKTTAWAELSVYDFFKAYNWTGEPPKLDPLHGTQNTVDASSFLCLSLAEFLQQVNWNGKQNTRNFSQPITRSHDSLMTLSVTRFFQEMVWESSPEIAPMPQKNVTSKANSQSYQELDVNNLSDLF